MPDRSKINSHSMFSSTIIRVAVRAPCRSLHASPRPRQPALPALDAVRPHLRKPRQPCLPLLLLAGDSPPASPLYASETREDIANALRQSLGAPALAARHPHAAAYIVSRLYQQLIMSAPALAARHASPGHLRLLRDGPGPSFRRGAGHLPWGHFQDHG